MTANVTILNKLKRADSVTGLDTWYNTTVDSVEYKKSAVTAMSGTQVAMGESYTVLIPFSENYRDYNEWKGLVDKAGTYTMTTGDLIIFDALTEQVTPNDIAKLRQTYAGRICEVKSVEVVAKRAGLKYQIKVGGI